MVHVLVVILPDLVQKSSVLVILILKTHWIYQ